MHSAGGERRIHDVNVLTREVAARSEDEDSGMHRNTQSGCLAAGNSHALVRNAYALGQRLRQLRAGPRRDASYGIERGWRSTSYHGSIAKHVGEFSFNYRVRIFKHETGRARLDQGLDAARICDTCTVRVEKDYTDVVPGARQQKVTGERTQILKVDLIQMRANLKCDAKQKSIMRFRVLGLHE